MSSSSDRFSDPSSSPDPFLDLMYKAVMVLFCLPVAPGLLVGLLLARFLKGRDERFLALAVLGAAVGGALCAFVFHPVDALNVLLDEIVRQVHHTFQWLSLLRAALPLWGQSLLLAPTIGLIWYFFLPRSVEERALEKSNREATEIKRSGQRARSKMRRAVPYSQDGQGVMGVWIDGDLSWKRRGWFTFPSRELGQHGVVIGASGMGKTETLLRLAVFAAKVLRWQVVFVDAKGDQSTAARFVAAMKSAGVERVKCFPAEFYNGWVGDTDALLNRLLAIEDYSESAYYRATAENLVALALDAGDTLPSNSQEFMRRLRISNLLSYYKDVKGSVEETAYLEGTPRRDLAGVYNRYRATFAKLRGKLDGAWSYDDIDAAYILLDGLALRELASGLGRYLIEDFAHFAGLRKSSQRRSLFIFDELSAVDADVTNLFERVRSKGVSIFVSAQSYEGLGFKGMASKANRIISAATTLILHACSDPDELIRRAGKKKGSEVGYGFENDEHSTGRGTVRVKDELRVNPDVVRQLEIGQVYVVAKGRADRVQIAPVPIDPGLLEEAEAYVAAIPQSPVSSLPTEPVKDPEHAVTHRKTGKQGRKEKHEEEAQHGANESVLVEDDPDLIE